MNEDKNVRLEESEKTEAATAPAASSVLSASVADAINKHLNQNNYSEHKDEYPFKYILRNVKNGRMVEIKATSSFHAANLVGWRPRHVQVVSKKAVKAEASHVEPVAMSPEAPQVPAMI